jgi:hypothetical protein
MISYDIPVRDLCSLNVLRKVVSVFDEDEVIQSFIVRHWVKYFPGHNQSALRTCSYNVCTYAPFGQVFCLGWKMWDATWCRSARLGQPLASENRRPL